MKKKYLSIIVCATLLFLASCNSEELKTTSVKVNGMTDTTMVAKIDGHDITFDIKQAKFDNGFVMTGDSVTVFYVGNLRDGKVKAGLIRLVPRKPHIVDVKFDDSKELKTKTMTEEETNAFDEGVEYIREHNK